MDWIQPVQKKGKWESFVHTVIKFRAPTKPENFLNRWGSTCFSKSMQVPWNLYYYNYEAIINLLARCTFVSNCMQTFTNFGKNKFYFVYLISVTE
jgi:hypothetical protein